MFLGTLSKSVAVRYKESNLRTWLKERCSWFWMTLTWNLINYDRQSKGISNLKIFNSAPKYSLARLVTQLSASMHWFFHGSLTFTILTSEIMKESKSQSRSTPPLGNCQVLRNFHWHKMTSSISHLLLIARLWISKLSTLKTYTWAIMTGSERETMRLT